MTKNQKMLLGVGAVAVVGYLLWKKQQTSFTGVSNKFATVGSRQKNASGTGKLAKCASCSTSCTGGGPLHPQGLCTGITTAGNYTVANVYDCGNCFQGNSHETAIANTVYLNQDTTTSTHWYPGTPLGGKK